MREIIGVLFENVALVEQNGRTYAMVPDIHMYVEQVQMLTNGIRHNTVV